MAAGRLVSKPAPMQLEPWRMSALLKDVLSGVKGSIFQLVSLLSVRHLGDQRPLLPRLHADIVTRRCSPCR